MRLALAGGGTGGHLVPGLHLVERAADEAAGGPRLEDLLWFTSGRAIEDRVLAGFEPPCPYERVTLALEPPGGGAPSSLRLVRGTPGAVLRARSALRAHRCDVLLGLGGFTSWPAALAARSLGIPVALLEINAASGRATRWVAPLAKRIFHAWSGTLPPGGGGTRHRKLGAPVPRALTAVAAGEVNPGLARSELGFEAGRPLLVILGGSQGAGSLNAFAAEYAATWTAAGLQVLHQCGPGRRAEGPADGPGLRVEEYLTPVSDALAGATLVLCRGGASTLAEVAAARRPAVVVPYPHHADRHQEHNARELGEGVLLAHDEELDAALAARLVELCGPTGEEELAGMRAALERAGPADAAGALLMELELLSAGR